MPRNSPHRNENGNSKPIFKEEQNTTGGKNTTIYKKVGSYALTFHRSIHSNLYEKLLPKLKSLYKVFVGNLKEEFPAWLSWKVVDILFYLFVGYLYQKYKWKFFRFMLEA